MNKVPLRNVVNSTCKYTRLKVDWADVVAERRDADPLHELLLRTADTSAPVAEREAVPA